MSSLMDRRRALMATGSMELVDTSINATGFYMRKYGNESTVSGCRKEGPVKTWRDFKTGTEDFPTSSWTNGLASKDYDNPADFNSNSRCWRCKFGGSNTSPATSPRGSENMDSAYAFWKETGRIMFAGKNTPYYGMSNIDGTLAEPGWSG